MTNGITGGKPDERSGPCAQRVRRGVIGAASSCCSGRLVGPGCVWNQSVDVAVRRVDRRCMMSQYMTAKSQLTTLTPVERRHSLADRKRRVTRDAVVDAVIEAIREQGIDFSVQDAADLAGVTHRTIYRYFESRQALVEAVAERYEEWLTDQGIKDAESIEEPLAQMESLFRLFDQSPDLIRAVALHTLIAGERTARSQRRTERWRQMFEASLPNLPRGELEPVFAICRTLTGSLGWYLLTSQFGLTGEQSGRAVRRVVEAVIADLRRQEEEAARQATSGRER
jgi:AcrR family transcriptional regulator